MKALVIYDETGRIWSIVYGEETSVNTTASYTFIGGTYYGVVSSLNPDANVVSSLNKTIKNSKGYAYSSITCSDARICYAYPKSLGALSSIKDANNFDYIKSYTRTEKKINNIDYYIYILTDATTVSGFKQVYS